MSLSISIYLAWQRSDNDAGPVGYARFCLPRLLDGTMRLRLRRCHFSLRICALSPRVQIFPPMPLPEFAIGGRTTQPERCHFLSRVCVLSSRFCRSKLPYVTMHLRRCHCSFRICGLSPMSQISHTAVRHTWLTGAPRCRPRAAQTSRDSLQHPLRRAWRKADCPLDAHDGPKQ